MTAVAPPPNFQNISRPGYVAANGAPQMSSDDYRQMFMQQPRKSIQRANSSSSLNSNASSSTQTGPSPQPNGVAAPSNGDASTWAARKKLPRGLWPTTKTEPVSGISTARPQSIASAGSGPSAASAMTALHTPAPMVPSQHQGPAPAAQQNGGPRAQQPLGESTAILHLIPLNGTFERKTITVPFFPEVLRIGRQTNNKTIPTPTNGYFDSKVLSRQHAEIWADRTGKIWIRDVRSSNGTFVNTHRLSPENRDSDPHELREKDTLELGIDIVSEDQKTIVHHKVAARVEHAGIYSNTGANMSELNFGDLDSSQMSNFANGQPQPPNMRGRTGSQGSMAGGRLQGGPGPMGNNAGMQQPRHPNFWLQPVTMEQVVKKLNAEIKAARLQNQELQQTHQYINSILATEPKKEPSKSGSGSHKVSPIKDIKRFSDPPMPPPQQPLPEKPDAPSIRRSDTERPLGTSSPARDNRISSLADALNSAKKEIEIQSVRVQDLEALLTQERRAREDAEERANRLLQESLKDQNQANLGVGSDGETSKISTLDPEDDKAEMRSFSENKVDVATTRLQSRLESMVNEMSEMKQQMERYRQRAEEAEAESALHRQTLAEMVEKIRQDDAKTAQKAARRHSRSGSDTAQASSGAAVEDAEDIVEAEEGEITIFNEKDVEGELPDGLLTRVGLRGGELVNGDASGHLAKSAKSSHTLTTRQPKPAESAITHGAPAFATLAVVALGVTLMAYLNSYPKVER